MKQYSTQSAFIFIEPWGKLILERSSHWKWEIWVHINMEGGEIVPGNGRLDWASTSVTVRATQNRVKIVIENICLNFMREDFSAVWNEEQPVVGPPQQGV